MLLMTPLSMGHCAQSSRTGIGPLTIYRNSASYREIKLTDNSNQRNSPQKMEALTVGCGRKGQIDEERAEDDRGEGRDKA